MIKTSCSVVAEAEIEESRYGEVSAYIILL